MVFYKVLVEKALDKKKELDLDTAQLAARSGLSEDVINDFEAGSTKISVEGFLRILDALNIALSASSF